MTRSQLTQNFRRSGITVALAITAVALTLSGCSAASPGPASSKAASPGPGPTSAARVQVINPGKLTVCADISFPPFEFYDKNQQPTGSDIDIANALAKHMGLTAKFQNISFSGIVPAIQANQCDTIISGLFDTPERRKVLDFADYMQLGNVIVVRSNDTKTYNNLKDLSGVTVGAEAGSGLAQELSTENKKLTAEGERPMTVQTFPKDSDALQQLLVGHINAYYTTASTQAYYALQNPGKTKTASPQLSVQKVGAATLKSKPELNKAITDALSQVVSSGTLTRIFNKWDLKDADLK